MTTREQTIQLADKLIREKGYNAFSFSDISEGIGIRKASIHYHFPQKIDLGVAVVDYHIHSLNTTIESVKGTSPLKQLDRFLNIYSQLKRDNKVCIVGSLTTDYNTLDKSVTDQLTIFSSILLKWVASFLQEGRALGLFHYSEKPRIKAMLVISTMMASVQLTRVTSNADFNLIQLAIKNDLLKKK